MNPKKFVNPNKYQTYTQIKNHYNIMPPNSAVRAQNKVKVYLENLGENEVSKEYDYLKAIQLRSPSQDDQKEYTNPYLRSTEFNVYNGLSFN